MSGKQNRGGRKTAAQRQEEERQQPDATEAGEGEQPDATEAGEGEQPDATEAESEQPAGPRPDFEVAPRQSVCAPPKGTFDEGDAIKPADLGGGMEALQALIKKGVVIDNR